MKKIISETFINNSITSEKNLRLASFVYIVSQRYTDRSFRLTINHIKNTLQCSRSIAEKIRKDVLKDSNNFQILRESNGVQVVSIPSMKVHKTVHFTIENKNLNYKNTKNFLKGLAVVTKIATHNFISGTSKKIKYSSDNELKRLKKKYAEIEVNEEIAYSTLSYKVNRSKPTVKRWVKKAIEDKSIVKYCSDMEYVMDCDFRTYHKIKESDNTVFLINGKLFRQSPNTYTLIVKSGFRNLHKKVSSKNSDIEDNLLMD